MSKRKKSTSQDSVSSSSDVNEPINIISPHDGNSPSRWQRSDLEALGVFYDTDPLSIEDFYFLLKERRKFELPAVVEPFIDFTNKFLAFSFNVNHILTRDVGRLGVAPPLEETVLCELLEKEQVSIDECDDKFINKLTSKDGDERRLSKKLFRHWSTKAVDFLEDCKDMVQRLYRPGLFTQKGVYSPTHGSNRENLGTERESIYRDLFLSWSRMFFLRSRIGDSKQTEKLINGKEFNATPGVRFYAQANRAKVDPVMLLLCEVKRHSVEIADVEEDVWIAKRLPEDILGQVGIELVLDSVNSEFRPYVLGIICIETELIFVFLDIEGDHADAILTNKSTEGKQAHIRYTEPYNYLIADDRRHLTELFFWLGCLQKHDLNRYYLKKSLQTRAGQCNVSYRETLNKQKAKTRCRPRYMTNMQHIYISLSSKWTSIASMYLCLGSVDAM